MSGAVTAAQTFGLRSHATTSNAAIEAVSVTIQRVSPQQLQLTYRASGDVTQLRIPATCNAERRDALWRHTCAEFFIGERGKSGYYEFNFSPSSCWAAYEFSDYRQAMRNAEVAAPSIQVMQTEQRLQLQVMLTLPAAVAAADVLQASLTMVIEDHAGQYSYWAVSHAVAKPDFHCRDSFVINL